MSDRIRLLGAAIVVVAAAAGNVRAQELAGTFDQLRVLVKTGDRIRVTDNAGREILGTVADIASSSLTLLSDGTRRDLAEADINTIRQRRPDPLANGARWGFGIGAVLGVLAGIGIASGDGNATAAIPLVGIAYAGLGAGVGAGLDAMVSAEQVIYARRTGASARMTIIPVFTRSRRAVGLSISLKR